MPIHNFDTEIAMQVGVNAATIYQNFCFWLDKNRANEKHFYEKTYWTYNSVRALSELHPYLTPSQVRTAMDKLIEHELLIKGNFNKKGYDRTLWYSAPLHLLKIQNGSVENNTPIPDKKPDKKPDITPLPPKGDDIDENDIVDFSDERLDAKVQIPFLDKFIPDRALKDFAIYDLKLTADEFRDAMTLCTEYWRGRAKRANGKKTPRGWKAAIKSWLRKDAVSLKAKWRPAPVDLREQTESTKVDPSSVSDDIWEYDVRIFRDEGTWRGTGPAPDQDGCLAPKSILQSYGYDVTANQ